MTLLHHPIFTISLSLFFLMDAIGNVPVFISLLKHYSPARQRVIIIRELLIALALILIFYFIGDVFLQALGISEQTVRISGGIILFLIALKMIFPGVDQEKPITSYEEPLVVPLAIPLVAGPAILAAVMIYSRQSIPVYYTLIGIGIAWISSTMILLTSPFLHRILGKRGLTAIERLMGLILILIAIQMFLDGAGSFLDYKLAH
jgi:multiple antibiotic resistance protein